MKNEIIIYQVDELSQRLEVLVEHETVWLNRHQLSSLFDRDVKTIGKHINNIFDEGELVENSTVAKFATVQIEGNRKIERLVEFYNLDVIISVGYRVKSKRGTQFRIWASKVLKDYLLKGYAVNNRIEILEKDVQSIKNKLIEIDIKVCTNLTPKEGIFFDGQVFDAYAFASDLIKKANKSIHLIDNYIDETVLLILAKRKSKVTASIYMKEINQSLSLDLQKHNQQYPIIEIIKFTKAHDRFLIIDNQEVYHLGASLKDLGKKLFAFSKMELNANELLKHLNL